MSMEMQEVPQIVHKDPIVQTTLEHMAMVTQVVAQMAIGVPPINLITCSYAWVDDKMQDTVGDCVMCIRSEGDLFGMLKMLLQNLQQQTPDKFEDATYMLRVMNDTFDNTLKMFSADTEGKPS